MAATRSEFDNYQKNTPVFAADKAALTEQLQYLQRSLTIFTG